MYVNLSSPDLAMQSAYGPRVWSAHDTPQVVQTAKRTGQLTMISSPRALLGAEKKRTLRHNARAKQHWERLVLHQGWLRKRGGGAVKRWIWRYFVLYDTPQGHFLAYYNDVSDTPLFCEARRERQLVDMCQVCPQDWWIG